MTESLAADAGRDTLANEIAKPEANGRCVVARLLGGLGNQMFQYAAGRSLARRTGSNLVLDATALTLRQQRRSYALAGYRIAAAVSFAGYAHAPRGTAIRFPRSTPYEWLDGVANLFRSTADPADAQAATTTFSVFAEQSFDFDPRFGSLGAQTYLVGYWQSARYFDDSGDAIRSELTFASMPNAVNAHWLARIGAVADAVCVHVRRGDYLNAAQLNHHGLCSPGYYRRAMRLVRERAPAAQFFIFSDDWPWCREHLAESDTVVVDANDPGAAQDELRLMASCRHHIIANSSLSWWAAWLAARGGQIVIAPKPWFTRTADTPDLLPAGWLALPRD